MNLFKKKQPAEAPTVKTLAVETKTPIPYREVDKSIDMDLTVSLFCRGELDWQVTDEATFRQMCVKDDADLPRFEELLCSEVTMALTPALMRCADQNISYTKLSEQNDVLSAAVLDGLAPRWEQRGIRPLAFRLTGTSIDSRSEEMIANLRKMAELRDPAKAAAALEAAMEKAKQALAANGGWICPYCDTPNTGKFCTACGAKKPE